MIFSLGYMEIAVICVLIILLFPPREIPKLARSVARGYGSLRRTADDFRKTVMLDDELRQPFEEIRGAYSDARWKLESTGREIERELSQAARQVKTGMKPDSSTSAELGREGKKPLPASSEAETSAPAETPAATADEREDSWTEAGPKAGLTRAPAQGVVGRANPFTAAAAADDADAGAAEPAASNATGSKAMANAAVGSGYSAGHAGVSSRNAEREDDEDALPSPSRASPRVGPGAPRLPH